MIARVWPLLAAAALVEIVWVALRVYRRRRFETWLRRQMAEVGSW